MSSIECIKRHRTYFRYLQFYFYFSFFTRYNLLKIDDRFFNKFLIDSYYYTPFYSRSRPISRFDSRGIETFAQKRWAKRIGDSTSDSVRKMAFGSRNKGQAQEAHRQRVRSRANREEGVIVTSLKTRSRFALLDPLRVDFTRSNI